MKDPNATPENPAEADPTLRERLFGIPDRYPRATAAAGTAAIVHADKIVGLGKRLFARGSKEAVAPEETEEAVSALFGGGGGRFKGL